MWKDAQLCWLSGRHKSKPQRCHFLPIQMAVKKNSDNHKCWRGCGNSSACARLMEAENGQAIPQKTKQSYCLTQRLHSWLWTQRNGKQEPGRTPCTCVHSGGVQTAQCHRRTGRPTAVVCTQERMWLQLGREDALASATARASHEGFVLSELSQTQKGQPAGLCLCEAPKQPGLGDRKQGGGAGGWGGRGGSAMLRTEFPSGRPESSGGGGGVHTTVWVSLTPVSCAFSNG